MKIEWVVEMVAVETLQEFLQSLTDDGYVIFKILQTNNSMTMFHVIAHRDRVDIRPVSDPSDRKDL